MRTIAYSCPFVPPEWIAAHGLRPRRIMPRSAGGASFVEVSGGRCAYAQAFIQEVVTDSMRPTLRTRLEALVETAKGRRPR